MPAFLGKINVTMQFLVQNYPNKVISLRKNIFFGFMAVTSVSVSAVSPLTVGGETGSGGRLSKISVRDKS